MWQVLSRVYHNSSCTTSARSYQMGARFSGYLRCEYLISASQQRLKTTGGVLLGGVAWKSEAFQTRSWAWAGEGKNEGTVGY